MHKILIVDDEYAILKILKTYLSKKGFEVISAQGGEKAIEILHSDIKADFAIIDMKMPKVKGIDVVQEMKKVNMQIPFIILSGSLGIEECEKEIANLGFSNFRYLMKPIDLDQLLDTIKKMQNPGSKEQ